MFAVIEKLYLALEASVSSNPDPMQTTLPTDVLAGIIYTVRPGLDLDAGYIESNLHKADMLTDMCLYVFTNPS